MPEPRLATKTKAPRVMSAPKNSSTKTRPRWLIALGVFLFLIVFAAANTRLGIVTVAFYDSSRADSKGKSFSVAALSMTDVGSFRPGVRCPPGNETPCVALRKIVPGSWSVDVTPWTETHDACGFPFVQSTGAMATGRMRIVTDNGGFGATTQIEDELDRTGPGVRPLHLRID
jgi:hypothetical protein